MNIKDLTYKEVQWLDSRGGRNEDDVFEDEIGKYCMMNNKDGILNRRVYLPKVVDKIIS